MPTVAELGEFGLIARLTAALSPSADVVTGVGDDAAILKAGAGWWVATCDAQVEDVHFRLRDGMPEEIGHRALAVNLSDIAAMGAIPRFALISLLIPATLELAVLDAIYAGLRAEAERYGVAIVGGNVARNPERLILDITLLGVGTPERLLRRSGARPGDDLLVTGTLGAAAAGLLLMQTPWLDVAEKAALIHAQRLPTPRISAGQWLAAHGATAALDVSDGLLADLNHLCVASGAGARLDLDALPIAPGVATVAMAHGRSARDLALGGGEDYELLFTVPGTLTAGIVAELLQATGVPATPIGTIVAGTPEIQDSNGQPLAIVGGGWDHLRNEVPRDK